MPRRRDPAAHAAFLRRMAAGIARAIDALPRPSARNLADHVNWQGLRSKTGRPWTLNSISILITELRAAGLLSAAREAKYRAAGKAAQAAGMSAWHVANKVAEAVAGDRLVRPAERSGWPKSARFTDVDPQLLQLERLREPPWRRAAPEAQSYCGNSSAMCAG